MTTRRTPLRFARRATVVCNSLNRLLKRVYVMLIPQAREKHLLFPVENRQKADPSCRLQQGLQAEIGTSLRPG